MATSTDPNIIADPNQTAIPYTGLIGSIPNPTAIPRNIAPSETVSGQLDNLLKQDSPYIQSARANGLITANNRGLLNSSLAAGASEKSAIDAAAPIAAQDAATYAASGLSAQGANQNIAQTGYQGQVDSVKGAQNLYNSTVIQEQQGKITSDLQAQKDQATSTLQTHLAQMGVDVDMTKINAANQQAYVNAISPVMTTYQQMVATIQTTPDSSLTPEAKAVALANLKATYGPQLQSISNIYGYQVNW